MPWHRNAQEATQDAPHIEARLAEIAESQSALNRNTQEIKDITAEIVKTLNSGISNDLLLRLVPALEPIPSLVQEMTSNIKSFETQFVILNQSQQKVQNDLSSVISLITDLTAQLRRIS
jgi:hypothetical protein